MRLIDADELWEKMYKYTDNEGAKMPYGDDDSLIRKDSACFIIENAPTIEPEQRWIPCSIKKHPDSTIECYVTVKDYTDDYGEEYDLIVDEDTYYPEHDAWDYYCDLDVIAWMPKNEPKEPYQPKEDES